VIGDGQIKIIKLWRQYDPPFRLFIVRRKKPAYQCIFQDLEILFHGGCAYSTFGSNIGIVDYLTIGKGSNFEKSCEGLNISDFCFSEYFILQVTANIS